LNREFDPYLLSILYESDPFPKFHEWMKQKRKKLTVSALVIAVSFTKRRSIEVPLAED
jgi:hypothetical protein